MSTHRKTRKLPNPPQEYSEAFKRQVVAEYESGLSTKATLKRKYGIAGNSCIPRWCKRYGKLPYLHHTTKGRPMSDPQKQRIKELEEQLKRKEQELQEQLKQKDAELAAYQRFIEIAECLVLVEMLPQPLIVA